MPKVSELLKNQKRLATIAFAAGILILYIFPLDQVTSAPGNGQGNSYGPKGQGPPDFVPRGPNPNPGEPRGQPDGAPHGQIGTPPGQEKKLTINNELEKQGPQNENKGPQNENKGPQNENKGPKNEEKQSNDNVEIQSNDNTNDNNNENSNDNNNENSNDNNNENSNDNNNNDNNDNNDDESDVN